MNTRRKIAVIFATAAVLMGIGGAVAAAHQLEGKAPQAPSGSVVDLPEPGDLPDQPGQ